LDTAELVVGIDIGGTFTDLIAFDARDHRVYAHKELTTPVDPNHAVATGLRRLFAAHRLQWSQITRVVHATTLFANALIERRGAAVALVTTEGFRDVIEIGRERKYELYDLFIEMPRPLCSHERRYEVAERVDANGSVSVALAKQDLIDVASQALRESCESLAICFINAFVNPANEMLALEALKGAFPDVPVCASYQVANEIREFDRFSTTVANAYIQPIAERYLSRFEGTLRKVGITAPVYVMLSNGGLTTIGRAMSTPIQLLESGPAAGALAAAYFASLAGVSDVMALDIGGTTAKLCTIEAGVPIITHKFEAAREKRFVADSGLAIRIPTIDLIEIGAGGGSIAHLDQLGLLKVGPQSAGANPGPVCYGKGGALPTVSDANLLLGYLNLDYFAGGEIRLDAELASNALGHLAEGLGLSTLDSVAGVHDLANENMAAAARVHAAERGRDPSSLALVVTGGGGPIHGPGVARKLGMRRVICPPAAGVASAIGLVMAPVRVDTVAFVMARLGTAAIGVLEEQFSRMEAQARRDLSDMHVLTESLVIARSADMRYAGQGFEIFVSLPAGPYDQGVVDRIRKAFDSEYEKIFGQTVDAGELEIVNVRLAATVDLAHRDLPAFPPATKVNASLHERPTRIVRFTGDRLMQGATPVFRWNELPCGASVAGPALIEQEGTTLAVAPGDQVEITASGVADIEIGSLKGTGYTTERFNNIGLEVLWKRLIGIVDEASAALVRCSFSTVVRESDDYSIVITDQKGRLVAQGTKSIPVFISSLPRTVKHFLDAYRTSELEEDDVLITNNPWQGTGHLFDINLALPIFRRGKLVAFAASTAHAADIGGRSGAQKIPDVFEEGLQIPIMKLASRGQLDRSILALLKANVRAPDQVLGDLHGQISALSLVRKRLLSVMAEWELISLDAFVDESVRRTESAMRSAISSIPRGTYHAEQRTDGMETPIVLKVAITVTDGDVVVDYAGSSEQIPAALNVAYAYTHAFTVYALKCMLDRESPNNEGSFAPFRVIAPEGSILNHRYPFSGANRALVGHYLPSLVLEALAPAVPDQVIAGVGSPIWSLLLRGRGDDGRSIVLKCFFNGGMGASTSRNGLSATSWPSNISCAPIEVIEQIAPVRITFKRLRPESGGAGRYRGGLGLEVEFVLLAEGPFSIGFNAERTRFPANGLFGGKPGAVGELCINGKAIDVREMHQVRRGDRVLVRTPGGGGVGPSVALAPDTSVTDTDYQQVSAPAR